MKSLHKAYYFIKNRINPGKVAVFIALLLFVFSILSIYVDFTGNSIENEIQPSNGKIAFAAWGSPAERAIMKTEAKNFSDKNNITVDVYCFSDLETYRTKVLAQFAAGDSFDVFYTDDVLFDILAQKGWLLNLSAASKKVDKSDFYTNAFEKGIFNQKLYGLPIGINPTVVYYNAKLFREAGIQNPDELYRAVKWDFNSFTEICRKIKKYSNTYGMTIKNDWPTVFSIIRSISSKTINFDIDGSILTDEPALDAFRQMKELVDKDYVIYLGGVPRGVTEDELFESEKVAIVLAGYEYVSVFNKVKDLEWDIVPFPSDSKGFSISALDIPILSVSSSTKDPDLSSDFALYYTGSECQKFSMENGGKMLSSLKSVNSESALKMSFPKHYNYFFDSLEYGFTEDTALNYLQNKAALYSRLNDYWLGLKDLYQAARSP